MKHRYTAIFEQAGGLWMGFVEELPGANAQGESLEEARENLKEAIRGILEANRAMARENRSGRRVVREELTVHEAAMGKVETMFPKDHAIRTIQDLPADSSWDEILRELVFARMIDRGLADADAGRTISQEEMGQWIEAWGTSEATPRGASVEDLKTVSGTLDDESAREMMDAIEESCGRACRDEA